MTRPYWGSLLWSVALGLLLVIVWPVPRPSVGIAFLIPLFVFLRRRGPGERRSVAIAKGASAGMIVVLVNAVALGLMAAADLALIMPASNAIQIIEWLAGSALGGMFLSLVVVAAAALVAAVGRKRD